MYTKKLNPSPGTLRYSGAYQDQPLLLTLYQYAPDFCQKQSFSREQIGTLITILKHNTYNLWLNVVGLAHVDEIAAIGKAVGIEALWLEDVFNVSEGNKWEREDKTIFATLSMMTNNAAVTDKSPLVDKEHIAVVQKPGLVITFQEKPQDVFSSVRDRLEKGSYNLRHYGSEYLLYALMDALTDYQMDVNGNLSNLLESCELAALDRGRVPLEKLYQIRKALTQLRSACLGVNDLLMLLLEKDVDWMPAHLRSFFEDVSDHSQHVLEQVQVSREMVTSLYELHSMETAERMNRIMTTLTLFSTVFIPLNFLASFFGMNFKHFSWLDAVNGVPIFLLMSLALSLGMLLVFKNLRWIK